MVGCEWLVGLISRRCRLQADRVSVVPSFRRSIGQLLFRDLIRWLPTVDRPLFWFLVA